MHKRIVLALTALCLSLAACQSTPKGGIEDDCTARASDAGLCQDGVQVDS